MPNGTRKQPADRERRLEALTVEVLTALGERDGAIRDAELSAEGRTAATATTRACPWGKRPNGEAVASHCEVARLRRLANQHSGGSGR